MKKNVSLWAVVVCFSLWGCRLPAPDAPKSDENLAAFGIDTQLKKIDLTQAFEANGVDSVLAQNQMEREKRKAARSSTALQYLRFNTLRHVFGRISQGQKMEYVFTFENIANIEVAVADVEAGCGCTSPSYSKEPIPPGGKGFVRLSYDPAKDKGPIERDLLVKTRPTQGGATAQTLLVFAAEVGE